MATFFGPASGKRSGTTRVGTNRDGANMYLMLFCRFSVSLYSGYRQDARIAARPRKSAPTGSWRLSQNPGSVSVMSILRACLIPHDPLSRHLVSLRSRVASCEKVSILFISYLHRSISDSWPPSSRVGWPIRHDLVPLFGPTFPTTCLSPDQPGYGTVIPPTGRRKPRRSLQSVGIPPPHNVPYPPKLPLAKEYVYNVADHSAPHMSVPHLSGPNEYYHFRPHGVVSNSPVDNHNAPFATPSVPTVPALVSVDGPGYSHSPQEADSSSQYIHSSAAYPPLRERPIKPRYSPYAIPGRNQSPSTSVASYHIPSPLGYDQPLVHRSSDPNLRGAHTRSHLTLPRLNTQQLLSANAKARSLSAISPAAADPEAYELTGVNGGIRRLKSTDDLTGGSSGDSVRSSIPTTPFNE
jgi:hypothetical protein